MKRKNIFIFLQIIIFLTLCIFIIELFINKEEISDKTLNSINEAEIDTYLRENTKAFIYLCIDNEICNKYNEMIYDADSEIELIQEIQSLYTLDYANVYSKYTDNKKMAKIPVLLVIEDMKIIDELGINDNTDKKDIKEFLKKYE